MGWNHGSEFVSAGICYNALCNCVGLEGKSTTTYYSDPMLNLNRQAHLPFRLDDPDGQKHVHSEQDLRDCRDLAGSRSRLQELTHCTCVVE